ncbi:hypothetical protein SFR_6072 [Streptomyces sp. FR-008]|nr:hypothetical protein SFR_6072 [Streptomyces sp. FR-008]
MVLLVGEPLGGSSVLRKTDGPLSDGFRGVLGKGPHRPRRWPAEVSPR